MIYQLECPGCKRKFEAGGWMGDDGGYSYHTSICMLYHLKRVIDAKQNRKITKPRSNK
jgi:hypothetical protein